MNISNDSINEEYNQNITAFIEENLGAPHINYETLVPLTIIYSLFLVVGILGNLATCIVILNNEYLRNATNVYLTNLAIADIFTLVFSMPLELHSIWVQYPWTLGDLACDAKIVLMEAIIYSSILTIVAFSFERYMAICKPLSPMARSSMGEARKIILLIWIISFISALPWAMFTKVNYLEYNDVELKESAWCTIPFNEESNGPLYMMLGSTIIYFCAPIIIVTLLYSKIGLTLNRNKMQRCAGSCGGEQGTCEAERSYLQGKRTVIRMLVAVVFAFFFCWSPFHTQRLMFVLVTLYGEWTETLKSVQHILFTISGVFFYFNSMLNPILYSLMSKRFRRGFSDIRHSLCNRLLALSGPSSHSGQSEGSGSRKSPRRIKPRHWIPKDQREQILLKVMNQSPAAQNLNSDAGSSFDAVGKEIEACDNCTSPHKNGFNGYKWRKESKVYWNSDTDTTRIEHYIARTVSEGGSHRSPSRTSKKSSRKSSFRDGFVNSDKF